ncbi:N-alpha-acetyltransferase 60 [Hondaea fermentalgiana]|uniref:N-alpha-acetyltransferase 60 n=1 Tax=Hondaea fermentalgiana TaxID=2315210 RepID=A0A2R5G902_9STRA|nr:N-alpha-acetyltransferase 60 [Hondaea fermentalgiana]|eukprot:GBG24963.1 N-alpha-acetyltransferase 60 [Hondaea fermentalgiana]
MATTLAGRDEDAVGGDRALEIRVEADALERGNTDPVHATGLVEASDHADLGTQIVAAGTDALAPCTAAAGARRPRPASWGDYEHAKGTSQDIHAPTYAELAEGDVGVLRRLHEMCFPVKYNDKFYMDLGKRTYQEKPLITRVAHKQRPKRFDLPSLHAQGQHHLLQDHQYRDGNNCSSSLGPSNAVASSSEPRSSNLSSSSSSSSTYSSSTTTTTTTTSGPMMDEIGVECVIPDAHLRWPRTDNDQEMETILLGGISAQLRSLNENDIEQPRLSAASKQMGYYLGCYVLTIATHPYCRRSGVGSKLLNYVIETAASNPACGVVYLHVITYNEAALRFYERHGFRRVETLTDFYRIDGRSYDAYLYAKFLGEAKPDTSPKTLWAAFVQHVSNFFSTFWHER